MLISNIWIETGLVNGSLGTIKQIVYKSGGPPNLPIAVTVLFDNYRGPTLHDNTVPISPIQRNWIHNGKCCSRLQLPLGNYNSQITLDKAIIDIGFLLDLHM